MNGFTAAAQLANRAAENGYTIEFIILAASVIDGALRIGLVLEHQLSTKSTSIPNELVYQSAKDKAISEREIYRRSLARSVIDKELFDELQELYYERNRVVHRYIISEITTEHVFNIARRYENVIEKVNNAVWVVEDRQIKLGIGMTQKAAKTGNTHQLNSMAAKKHGAEWLSKALRKKGT